MRKSYINIICFILVFASFSACSITNDFKDTTTHDNMTTSERTIDDDKIQIIEIYLPHSLVAASGRNADILASEFKETNKVCKIVVNDSGTDKDSITMSLTLEQKQWWLKSRKELLDDLNEKMSQYDSDYHITYDDECTELSLYYDLKVDANKVAEFKYIAEFLCGMYQVLNGVNDDNWNVNINIYNSKTKKLVTSGSSVDGLSYEAEDWIRSEKE